MPFRKIFDTPISIKRLPILAALSFAINLINIGCSSVEVANQQAELPNIDFKQWVLDAELLRERGDLKTAQRKLDLALQVTQKNDIDPADRAAVELAVGYNLFLLNRLHAAEQHLTEAYPQTAGNHYLQALADQYLANLYLANGDKEQAVFHINHGLNLLKPNEYETLRLSLDLLRLRTGPEKDGAKKAHELLTFLSKIGQIPNSVVKSKLCLNIMEMVLDIKEEPLPNQLITELQQKSYQMLNQLLPWADQSEQSRLKAETNGKLAQLYSWQGRYDEALELFNRAINEAQNINATELLVQLAAQKGKLLRLRGDNQQALAAYKIAADNLFSIRSDLPLALPDGRNVLNTLIDPIYRNYVDLLLQTVQGAGQSEKSTQILSTAVDTMEAIKEADMQDFFLGRCSIDSQNDQSWKNLIFQNAAIFYPILLDDRVELILKINNTLTRFTVNVPAKQVQTQALALTKALQHGKDYRSFSKQLYQWLFLPIKNALETYKPSVILYVPDRSLRAVPLSALYDGRSFVVEDYGIVTLPSLALRSLSAIYSHPPTRPQALLAGLSKPDGSSIDQLPSDITGQLSDTPLTREAIIEELSLPSVEEEIRTVAEIEQSRTLLNDKFTASALKSDIETGEYGKVHIASHGYFGKNAKESFIMAYDQNMNLLDIKDTLETESLKAKPIDLLTLSACKTAEGDDSMLLGFSGLAAKSNVLSAVGSLWSINDDATMEFMRLFYDNLAKSNNKAEAMRKTQITMIHTKRFRHPFFWSPFILIGDWQ